MSELLLIPAEARVLAALVEKSITTPQYYPMTVNALMLAANQKTVRNPVMNLSEGDTGAALNRLERDRLAVRDGMSGRVIKWRHQMQHQMLLKTGELAVLVTLMLRGPQTGSELRANAHVLGGPADAEGLQTVLASLHDRAQPLVTELPRAPGQKEARQAHLLCGVPTPGMELVAPDVRSHAAAGADEVPSQLEQRLRALEARVSELEQRLAQS
ncbi:MAG: YceH family protein [Nevskiales bacterium]